MLFNKYLDFYEYLVPVQKSKKVTTKVNTFPAKDLDFMHFLKCISAWKHQNEYRMAMNVNIGSDIVNTKVVLQ